jgi:peroxiredoxin
MPRVLMTLLLATLTTGSFAGEHNAKLSIGDAAPAWAKLPGTDGKHHSLDDLKDKKLVVVVFTCNSCPVAVDYEDRIIEFAKKHAADVAVVAINVNRVPEDSLPKMKEKAKEKNLPYPYLFDESQQIAKEYGANGTPEFFVLTQDRKIAYMGAMDDSADLMAKKVDYLEPAVQAVLAGKKPEVAETYAHGCRIRYARKRR